LRADLATNTGEKWKEYSLEGLLSTVVDISELEDTDPAGWTVKTDRLVKILRSERNRLDRIEQQNKPAS
jgi:hypothetical protein